VPPFRRSRLEETSMDVVLVLISLAALAIMAGFVWAMERM
jgi:hypothetical protein